MTDIIRNKLNNFLALYNDYVYGSTIEYFPIKEIKHLASYIISWDNIEKYLDIEKMPPIKKEISLDELIEKYNDDIRAGGEGYDLDIDEAYYFERVGNKIYECNQYTSICIKGFKEGV